MIKITPCVHSLQMQLDAANKRIAELELKSCTLGLTKGHLRQCETALESRDKRIAELEAQLKSVLEDNTKLAQVRQAHNLRQQAKGIDWVLACRELNLSEGEVHTLMDKCNKLRKQADDLGQGE